MAGWSILPLGIWPSKHTTTQWWCHYYVKTTLQRRFDIIIISLHPVPAADVVSNSTITSVQFIFNHLQGLYPKVFWSLESTRFIFKVLQSLWNLTGGHLLTFKGIGLIYPNCAVVKRRKIFRKFNSDKTVYSRCNYGSPVLFVSRIWRPGYCLWTTLALGSVTWQYWLWQIV